MQLKWLALNVLILFALGSFALADDQEISVGFQVPASNYGVNIQEVHQVGDEVWVVSKVTGGGGIGLIAGMSRLYSFPKYFLLVSLAITPLPLLFLAGR